MARRRGMGPTQGAARLPLRWLLLSTSAALAMAYGSLAQASSCTLGAGTTSTMDFGAVNPLLPADTVNDSGQVTVTCTFTALGLFARVCFNLGLGNTSTSNNPRTLGAGTNRMNYNLYTNTGRFDQFRPDIGIADRAAVGSGRAGVDHVQVLRQGAGQPAAGLDGK